MRRAKYKIVFHDTHNILLIAIKQNIYTSYIPINSI